MKQVKYVSFNKQEKGETNKISSHEWNYILNVLMIQANNNAEILQDIINLILKLEDRITELEAEKEEEK